MFGGSAAGPHEKGDVRVGGGVEGLAGGSDYGGSF
jgi:hypothetical protein